MTTHPGGDKRTQNNTKWPAGLMRLHNPTMKKEAGYKVKVTVDQKEHKKSD